MLLNNIEVKVLSTIELIDAYNNIFPEDLITENVIYCVHNKVNGKNYVGQTVSFKNRFSTSYVGHFKDYHKYIEGKLGNRVLYKAWKKYGLESFTVYIIDTGTDRDSLNEKEIYWIKTLHTCTKDPECKGYNLSWGADDMGVKDSESIKKSLATRLEKYGSYISPTAHTPEALAKAAETKIKKYGYAGFVNAFTPEANEKRRRTNLEKYGTLYGQKASKEAIDRMVAGNIEKYGDPMGACNTPENRKKAVLSRRITNCFSMINKIATDQVVDLESYVRNSRNVYKSPDKARRHFSTIAELLDDLMKDSRWNSKLGSIFCRTPEEIKSIANSTFDLIGLENLRAAVARRDNDTIQAKQTVKKILLDLSTIQQNSGTTVTSWDMYKEKVVGRFSRPVKARDYFNRLIDLLPAMKNLDSWTDKLNKIFGHLTENDKV